MISVELTDSVEFNVERNFVGHQSFVRSVEYFGEPINKMVSGSGDGIRVWDTKTQNSTKLDIISGSSNDLIKFDEESFMCCSDDCKIIIFSIHEPNDILKEYTFSMSEVVGLLLLSKRSFLFVNLGNEIFVYNEKNREIEGFQQNLPMNDTKLQSFFVSKTTDMTDDYEIRQIGSQYVSKKTKLMRSKSEEDGFFITTNDPYRSVKFINHFNHSILREFHTGEKNQEVHVFETYLNSNQDEILITGGKSNILNFYNASGFYQEYKLIHKPFKRVNFQHNCCSVFILGSLTLLSDFSGNCRLYNLQDMKGNEGDDDTNQEQLQQLGNFRVHHFGFRFKKIRTCETEKSWMMRMISCSDDNKLKMFDITCFKPPHDVSSFIKDIFVMVNRRMKSFLMENLDSILSKKRSKEELIKFKDDLIRETLLKYFGFGSCDEDTKKQKYQLFQHVIPNLILKIQTELPNFIDKNITIYIGEVIQPPQEEQEVVVTQPQRSNSLTPSKNKRTRRVSNSRFVRNDGFGIEFMMSTEKCFFPLYVGYFSNYLKEGIGSLYNVNNCQLTFTGSFEKNKRQGYGKEYSLINDEGRTYYVSFEGNYSLGKRSGYGESFDTMTSTITKGFWKNKNLVVENNNNNNSIYPILNFCPIVQLSTIQSSILNSGLFGRVLVSHINSPNEMKYKLRTDEIPSRCLNSFSREEIKEERYVIVSLSKCSINVEMLEKEKEEEEDNKVNYNDEYINRLIVKKCRTKEEEANQKLFDIIYQDLKNRMSVQDERLEAKYSRLESSKFYHRVLAIVKGENHVIGTISEYFPLTIHQLIIQQQQQQQQQHDGFLKYFQMNGLEEKMNIIAQTAYNLMLLHSLNYAHSNLTWKNVILCQIKKTEVSSICSSTITKYYYNVKLKGFFDEINNNNNNNNSKIKKEEDDDIRYKHPKYFDSQITNDSNEYCQFIAPEKMKFISEMKIRKERRSDDSVVIDLQKSDVFSFGLMMYSLLFDTQEPYFQNYFNDKQQQEQEQYCCGCDVSLKDIIESKSLYHHVIHCNLRPKIVLNIPTTTPKFLHDVMEKCWKSDPNKRPSFKEIVDTLDYEMKITRVPRNRKLSTLGFRTQFLNNLKNKSKEDISTEEEEDDSHDSSTEENEEEGEREGEGEEEEGNFWGKKKVFKKVKKKKEEEELDEEDILENWYYPVIEEKVKKVEEVDEAYDVWGIFEDESEEEEIEEKTKDITVENSEDLQDEFMEF